MTNKEQLELIAQARELCEIRVAEKRDELNELDKFNAQHPNHIIDYGRKRAEIVADLDAWTTHLAEMGEHEWQQVGLLGIACEKCSRVDFKVQYPCDFLVTKAKRLLGVTE